MSRQGPRASLTLPRANGEFLSRDSLVTRPLRDSRAGLREHDFPDLARSRQPERPDRIAVGVEGRGVDLGVGQGDGEQCGVVEAIDARVDRPSSRPAGPWRRRGSSRRPGSRSRRTCARKAGCRRGARGGRWRKPRDDWRSRSSPRSTPRSRRARRSRRPGCRSRRACGGRSSCPTRTTNTSGTFAAS